MKVFIFRTMKYALQDYWRNFWLSFITVSVIFIALFSFNTLLLVKTVGEYSLHTIEDKIDVSVFINPGVEESVVLDLRSRLLGMPEVKDVLYFSADDALKSFIARHKDDAAIIQSLEELGGNPLGAQLVIRAEKTTDYNVVVSLLNEKGYEDVIADQNFDEHTNIIDKISGIASRVRTIALIMTVLFTLIALIVVFNTIRIIIYTHRREIEIMRLVGATNSFISMPYLWQALLYSLLAVLIFLLIWYPLLGVIQPYINSLFTNEAGIDIVSYYNNNFLLLIGGQLLGLVLLLSAASFVALRRYSKV